MNTYNFYYGLLVEEGHLDNAYGWAEDADHKQNYDTAVIGISYPRYDVPAVWPTLPDSWTVKEAASPSWFVRIDTGYARNKEGKRMAVDPPTTVNLDCEEDYLGNSNSVGAGKERWISIFLKAKKELSDPRVDDNGATVYFVETETYELEVRQGPEETAPATTKPTLSSTDILISDIIIDENTGTNGILTADIDNNTRVERLMNLDVSGLQPSWYAGTKTDIRGRNLDEIAYALYESLMDVGDGYIDAAGTIPMDADFLPKTTSTYDLGSSSKIWERLYVEAILEKPKNAATSLFTPQTDFEDGNGHFRNYAKRIQPMLTGIGDSEWVDCMGRRRHWELIDVEHFLWYNGHAGPFPFKIGTGGTGAVAFNPATYAQTLQSGFAELSIPALGDAAKIDRQTFPLLAERQCETKWKIYGTVTTGNENIAIGMVGSGNERFEFRYDPTGAVNPGTPNGNWWCRYDDTVNTALWQDTGRAYSTAKNIWLIVSFEINASSGNLYVFFYEVETGSGIGSWSWDLTTLGATYESVARGTAWDIWSQLDTIGLGAGGGEKILLDYYKCRQFEEIW